MPINTDALYVIDQRGPDDGSLADYPKMFSWQHIYDVWRLKLWSNYGVDQVRNGEYIWKLVGFHVREGAMTLFPHVLGEDEKPYWHNPTNTGAYVLMTWPGCGEFPDNAPLRPDYNQVVADGTGRNYHVHCAVGNFTKPPEHFPGAGDADFTMGEGSDWIAGGLEGVGPGLCWVSAVPEWVSPQEGAHYSDGVSGLGWIGGTNHLACAPIFQKVLWSAGGGPPGEPGSYYLAQYRDGQQVAYIPMTTGIIPDTNDGTESLAVVKDGEVKGHTLWTPGSVPIV